MGFVHSILETFKLSIVTASRIVFKLLAGTSQVWFVCISSTLRWQRFRGIWSVLSGWEITTPFFRVLLCIIRKQVCFLSPDFVRAKVPLGCESSHCHDTRLLLLPAGDYWLHRHYPVSKGRWIGIPNPELPLHIWYNPNQLRYQSVTCIRPLRLTRPKVLSGLTPANGLAHD